MAFKQLFILLFVLFFWSSCSNEVKTPKEVKQLDQIENQAHIIWYWEDTFSQFEKFKLKQWIKSTLEATEKMLGVYPFTIHCTFHLSDADHPVPFGKTSRKKGVNEVHFYVNPSFELIDYEKDYTAQHELSHLSIPFINRDNLWFSEGYATYLSRLILVDQGYYAADKFDSLYFHKISDYPGVFNSSTATFTQVMDSLMEHHYYSHIYFGGSSFFYQVDKQLQLNDQSLSEVIRAYQKQNRLTDKRLPHVLASFDEISKSSYFTDMYAVYCNKTAAESLSLFFK
ncbi:hypothetical protein [Putridiphycobacter roseus]|nr:hypothetical protein [Putridiphycobacter roseus]